MTGNEYVGCKFKFSQTIGTNCICTVVSYSPQNDDGKCYEISLCHEGETKSEKHFVSKWFLDNCTLIEKKKAELTADEAKELLLEMKANCNKETATDPKRFMKSDAIDFALDSIERRIPKKPKF